MLPIEIIKLRADKNIRINLLESFISIRKRNSLLGSMVVEVMKKSQHQLITLMPGINHRAR